MKVTPTALPEVLHIEPRIFGDDRGYFLESWARRRYAAAGLPETFVQDNLSRSVGGILRGLHLQNPFPQGKLVFCIEGEVFDVAIDVRLGSPTFGRHITAILSGKTKNQLWIPPGYAHGFCVLGESALFAYKTTDEYHPETEVTIAWDDPALAIPWPNRSPTLSPKDRAGKPLAELTDRLPRYA